jgi:hypothetical protein
MKALGGRGDIACTHSRSASRSGRALSPRKGPPVPIVQEAGWAPEPVWTQRLDEKFFRLCRGSNLSRPVFQPVARHWLSYPALNFNHYIVIFENRASVVRFEALTADFSYSLCVQTGSGAHPAPVQWLPGVKRGRGVMLTTHPHQCRGREWVGAILHLPQAPSGRVTGLL